MKRSYNKALRVSLQTFKAAFDFLHGSNALYHRVAWDEETAHEYACPDGKGNGLLGLPPAFIGCVWRADRDKEDYKTVQEGAADAVSMGKESDQACESKDNGIEEKPQEANVFFAGVDEDHASFDTKRTADRIEILLRDRALKKAQRRHEELTTRQNLKKAGKSDANAFKCGGMRALEEEADDELLSELSKLRIDRMASELQVAQSDLDKSIAPPCGGCPLQWHELSRGCQMLVIPTHTEMLDCFDPKLWSAMCPGVFVYGDGVFKIERRSETNERGIPLGYRHRMSFREWCSCIVNRDELEYEDVGDLGEVDRILKSNVEKDATVPRGRANRDLMTVMYDLNRRLAYIHAARLYASKSRWSRDLKNLGELQGSDMYDALSIVGKNAGFKEILSCKNINERVKAAVKNVLICYSNVVGTNAARTT